MLSVRLLLIKSAIVCMYGFHCYKICKSLFALLGSMLYFYFCSNFGFVDFFFKMLSLGFVFLRLEIEV